MQFSHSKFVALSIFFILSSLRTTTLAKVQTNASHLQTTHSKFQANILHSKQIDWTKKHLVQIIGIEKRMEIKKEKKNLLTLMLKWSAWNLTFRLLLSVHIMDCFCCYLAVGRRKKSSLINEMLALAIMASTTFTIKIGMLCIDTHFFIRIKIAFEMRSQKIFCSKNWDWLS